MPSWQMVLLVQKLDRASLKAVLKRSAEYIFESGGTIRKMENLGQQTLPYKISSNLKRFSEGHFFLVDFDTGLDQMPTLKDKFKNDLDVIRMSNFLQEHPSRNLLNETPKPECTLHLDFLPPPYRPSVIEMQQAKEVDKKKKKKVKRIRSVGVSTDPFDDPKDLPYA